MLRATAKFSSGRSRWSTNRRAPDGVGLGVALEKPTVAASMAPANSKTVVVNRISLHRTVASLAAGMGCCFGDRVHACKQERLGKDVGFSNMFCNGSSGDMGFSDEAPACGFEVAGFLRSCHLCRKSLDGKDIYMYRGEKAFCSDECRYHQMINEEHQERRKVFTHSDFQSSMKNTSGQMFFYQGLVAA